MRIFYFLLIIIFPIILQSQVLWEKDSQGDIMMFKFSQSGAYLATASRYDNTVKITDIKSEKILQTIKNDSLAQLKFIQFGNGDSSLFAGFIIKGRVTVYQWDWQNKILFSSTITDSIGASLLKMSKDCNYLCGIDSILTPFLFDMRSKKMLDIEKFAEGDEVVDIDISDDSRIMALAMPEYINIVQLDSLSLQNSISAICHKFTKIYFSGGGGDFIAKFEPSEYTYIYDVAGGQQYQSVFWTDRPLGLYFLNKDTLISWGSSIRFYDLNTKDSSTTLYDASIGYFDIIKSEEKYIYAVKTLGVDIYELDNPIKLHALLIRYSNPFFIYDGKQLISNKIVMTSGTGAIVKNIMRNKNIIAYSDYYYCYTTDTTQKIYFDNYYSDYPTDSFKLPNKFSRAYPSRDLSAWIYNTSSTNYRYFDRNTGIDTAIADSAYYFEISRTGKYAAYYRGTRFTVNQFYLIELSSLKKIISRTVSGAYSGLLFASDESKLYIADSSNINVYNTSDGSLFCTFTKLFNDPAATYRMKCTFDGKYFIDLISSKEIAVRNSTNGYTQFVYKDVDYPVQSFDVSLKNDLLAVTYNNSTLLVRGTDMTVGIKEGSIIEQDIPLLYPNPFADVLFIEYSICNPEYVNIQIIDINGKSIRRIEEGIRQSGRYILHFDISGYVAGIYFIEVRLGARIYRLKAAKI